MSFLNLRLLIWDIVSKDGIENRPKENNRHQGVAGSKNGNRGVKFFRFY